MDCNQAWHGKETVRAQCPTHVCSSLKSGYLIHQVTKFLSRLNWLIMAAAFKSVSIKPMVQVCYQAATSQSRYSCLLTPPFLPTPSVNGRLCYGCQT